ncbi:hypothetical protein KSS87_013486 [Heliosperma pusillum]|nr:hypothetical protein KSS87_013486 [Heliosperma pusillum]
MADMMSDFDIDDPIPAITTKKRRNVIGLDDLFNDYKKDQEKSKNKKLKAEKTLKSQDSDDDDAVQTETKLTETFHNFQQTMKEVDGQESELIEHHQKNFSLSWGLKVFGEQKTSSECLAADLESSLLSQNFLNDEVSGLLEPSSQTGVTFLRGLLLNGWLSKLILHHGYLEESVAKWTLNLLLYSSEESLMTSACDFWCDILVCDKVSTPMIKIKWFPGFVELKRALESFGFQLCSPSNTSPAVQPSGKSEQESSKISPHLKGPPANIRAWIKFASACCRVRSRYSIFSTLEAQELVTTTVCLFLERKLLGLTSELHDSLLLAINYFEEKEWCSSCEKVTTSITDRLWSAVCTMLLGMRLTKVTGPEVTMHKSRYLPWWWQGKGRPGGLVGGDRWIGDGGGWITVVVGDGECQGTVVGLNDVDCISGVDTRSKQLRSALASEMLRRFTEITTVYLQLSDAKDILKFMHSKNLKDKDCDLPKIYIYFILIENWLQFSAEYGPIIKELWNGIIRKCSSQISNTDFRPCAQERLAYKQSNFLEKALEDFEHALQLDPNNKEANRELLAVVGMLVINPNGKWNAFPFDLLGSVNKGKKHLISDDVAGKCEVTSCNSVPMFSHPNQDKAEVSYHSTMNSNIDPPL